MLFKEFAGVDAFPICLDTHDPDEIVAVVQAIAPSFGGVNLEDISAPRCFEIEERLKAVARHPGLPRRSARHRGGRPGGAAERAHAHGPRIEDIADRDRRAWAPPASRSPASCWRPAPATSSAATRGERCIVERADYLDGTMHPVKRARGEATNPRETGRRLRRGDGGRRSFIGLSGARVIAGVALDRMSRDPIVFAMANPTPEVSPEEAARYARIIATGRSDYPNQINNVLCFPGIFRGALDVRATQITEEMKMAAARAIADIVSPRSCARTTSSPRCSTARWWARWRGRWPTRRGRAARRRRAQNRVRDDRGVRGAPGAVGVAVTSP